MAFVSLQATILPVCIQGIGHSAHENGMLLSKRVSSLQAVMLTSLVGTVSSGECPMLSIA